jgi:hypothetical protein
MPTRAARSAAGTEPPGAGGPRPGSPALPPQTRRGPNGPQDLHPQALRSTTKHRYCIHLTTSISSTLPSAPLRAELRVTSTASSSRHSCMHEARKQARPLGPADHPSAAPAATWDAAERWLLDAECGHEIRGHRVARFGQQQPRRGLSRRGVGSAQLAGCRAPTPACWAPAVLMQRPGTCQVD